MSTEIHIYRADCSGEHLHESQEMGFAVQYTAVTMSDAVRQAARFLGNRCKAFDLRPGCIKVSVTTVRPIAQDGSLQTRNGFPFFEWKHDTSPWTFEELIKTIGG
jgi:hypothetical protein